MVSRSSALDALWEQQRDASYKEGISQGAMEAFATMVIYGECTILGQTVPVRFDWPADTWTSIDFSEQVRELSRKVLQRAYAEGRQAAPPPAA